MKRIILNRYGAEKGKVRWQKIRGLYKKYLYEAPDIGGNSNLMSYNLYQSLLLFAFYEGCGKKLSEDEMGFLVQELVASKLRTLRKLNIGKALESKKLMSLLYKAMSKYAEKANSLRGGEWHNTWGIEINPENHEEGFAMTLTSCPIADFAKEHGYLDILPKICAIDHKVAEMLGIKLVRRGTIAEGAKACDYWYIKR